MSTTNATRTYFVDEAGDGTLFDAKGRAIAAPKVAPISSSLAC